MTLDLQQIDSALEELLRELQRYKSVSDQLTAAGEKADRAVAATEPIIDLSAKIREDNAQQVEAIGELTRRADQRLIELVSAVTEANAQQRDAWARLNADIEQKLSATLEQRVRPYLVDLQGDAQRIQQFLGWGLGLLLVNIALAVTVVWLLLF
jgi:hypothetical protein